MTRKVIERVITFSAVEHHVTMHIFVYYEKTIAASLFAMTLLHNKDINKEIKNKEI